MTREEIAAAKKERDRLLGLAVWKRSIRPFVAERANFRCETCGVYLGRFGEADHRIPRKDCEAHGISVTDPDNLQYLCPSCHAKKTNAERWAGHEKKPPRRGPSGRRAQVLGRNRFLAAAGILPGMEGMT